MRITVVVVVVSSLLSACRNIKRKEKRACQINGKRPKRLIVPEFRIHVNIRKQKKEKRNNAIVFVLHTMPGIA